MYRISPAINCEGGGLWRLICTVQREPQDNRHGHEPIIILFDIQVHLDPRKGTLTRAQISLTQKGKPIV